MGRTLRYAVAVVVATSAVNARTVDVERRNIGDVAGALVNTAGNVVNFGLDTAGNVVNFGLDAAGNVVNFGVNTATGAVNLVGGTVGAVVGALDTTKTLGVTGTSKLLLDLGVDFLQGGCDNWACDFFRTVVGGTFETPTDMPLFNSSDIKDFLIYPNALGQNPDGTSVPKRLTGIWWMDGNPLSDYVMTFGAAKWISKEDGFNCERKYMGNQENNAKVECIGGMYVPVYAKRTWTWHNTEWANTLGGGAFTLQLTYKFDCGSSQPGGIDYCQVYPGRYVLGSNVFLTLPKLAVHFDMSYANENLWIRNTFLPGNKEKKYYLKRLVTGDGEYTEHYDDYMSGGTADAQKTAAYDIFGFGADTRDRVSNVTSTMRVRV